MKKTTLTALLMALALLAGCAAGGEGCAGIPKPPETPPGPEQPQTPPSDALPGGTVTVTCRIVDGAETGSLILAGEEAHDIYVLNVSDWDLTDSLTDGMLVEVTYDGTILETWPAHFANASAIRPAASGGTDDRCGLYLRVLEDLWAVDPGLNSDVAQLGVDLSALSDLTDSEKSAVAYAFGNVHGILPITGTLEEIWEQGYLTPMTEPAEGRPDGLALYHWADGVHFSLTGSADDGFDAQKWRSGLGAYFYGDCTAVGSDDGSWTYEVGSEAIA